MKRGEDQFMVRVVSYDNVYMELEIVWILKLTGENAIRNRWRIGSSVLTTHGYTTVVLQEL